MADPEDLLRRYRPLGPRPELRRRILAPATGGRAWPWAAAAAALLVTNLLLHAAAGSAARSVSGDDSGDEAGAIAALSAALGGDTEAHAAAETIRAQERVRALQDAPVIVSEDQR